MLHLLLLVALGGSDEAVLDCFPLNVWEKWGRIWRVQPAKKKGETRSDNNNNNSNDSSSYRKSRNESFEW